jgi:hypothetical protein
MAAMMGCESVLRLHSSTYTGSGCLFTNGKVKHRTRRLATYEQFTNAFFKGADTPHRPV